MLSPSNLLSKKEKILVEDLVTERLLLTEINCPYRQVFEREIEHYNVNPYYGLEITSLKVLQDMVIAGLGIDIVPTAVVDRRCHNTVTQDIEGIKLELPVGITLLPEKSIPGLALDRLVNILKSELNNNYGAVND